MMPKIVAVSTAVPEYAVRQAEIREFAKKLFARNIKDVDRLLPVFENAGIDTRYFTKPLNWFEHERSPSEKNRAYIESSTSLCTEVIQKLFEQTSTSPKEIDYIIYVNSTGLATPTIDARLINLLGLRQDIRRCPIWGLGCAGGAAGLSHACHYLLGHPDERVLLVSCELCGLTFMLNDYSKSNLIACALFGEGAAAVLLNGANHNQDGLEIISTKSRFFPDSLDVMGWNVLDQGLQVVFAKRIPEIIEKCALDDLGEFTQENSIDLQEIDHLLFHPGGTKVIEAYQKALGLQDGQLNLSRDVLRLYGNMSSVTVLFVLEKHIHQFGFGKGGYGLLTALGPGFSSESLLLRM